MQDDAKQLVRSSGSVAANYIEANDALSKRDALVRLKICRKESKESELWIRLLRSPSLALDLEGERQSLEKEARELRPIFSAIVQKCQPSRVTTQEVLHVKNP